MIELPGALDRDWQALGDLGEQAIAAWAATRHGSLAGWLEALEALPAIAAEATAFGDTVTVAGPTDTATRARLQGALQRLIPWRKGPFSLFGVFIDSEWRSNRKWRRIADTVDFRDKRILDIGCGNGYYGWRMLDAGAAAVVGVDPTLLFVVQHAAIAHYLPAHRSRNVVLPLAGETIEPDSPFDVVSSMGVLYHRRDPHAHIADLERALAPGGELILETLIAPTTIHPDRRYANMRNIGCIPSVGELHDWLAPCFDEIKVIDATITTPAEQRPTAWMPFYSLEHALDRADPSRTVEGYPAPQRAVIIARRR